MGFGGHAVVTCIDGLPLIGSKANGAVAGLTQSGFSLVSAFSEGSVSFSQLAEQEPQLAHFMQSNHLLKEIPIEPQLRSAYLHITQRCNMACRGCYSANTSRNRMTDPSTAQLARAASLLADLGARQIVISGGEPFLRPDLPEVLAALHSAAPTAEIVLITNGSCINMADITCIAPYVRTIAISFNGLDENAGKLGRNLTKSAFDKGLHIIKNAHIPVKIITTLHRGNVHIINRYLSMSRNVDTPLQFSLFTSPNADGSCADLEVQPEQCRQILEAIGTSGSTPVFDEGNRISLSLRYGCGAGRNTLSVDADGTIYPCHLLHCKELALGNAYADSICTVRTNMRLGSLFSALSDEIEDCSSCRYLPLCAGGCRARAYRIHGTVTAADPLCSLSFGFYRGLIHGITQRFVLQ